MNCGKLTQDIYDRSVIKVIETNSYRNKIYYDGAGIGADCAILARNLSGGAQQQAGITAGQAAAYGLDVYVAARAYMAAVNHMAVCNANAGSPFDSNAGVNLTIVVPERLREIKVRGMVEAAARKAEEIRIPIVSCNVQVLSTVTEAVCTAVCVGTAALHANKKKAVAGEEIVMTKWIALEGTSYIATSSFDALCGRYPSDLVEEAAGFSRYLSVIPEAACAVESGASYMLMPREGGIFGGLWQLAADNGVGLVVDLKYIPVKQETIEVCEFFDSNPYELLAGGCLLVTVPNGNAFVHMLSAQGIPAAVIGVITKGNDRVVCHGDEKRFLEPARGDSLFNII